MAVNQMKNRMQALGLLDRAFKAASDEELATAIDALGDDHREGLESFVDEVSPAGVRAGVRAGRIDGGMEAIAAIVTDAALADCIEQLGDHADNPSSDQLREVMPGIVERHNLGISRIMLAGTVAGEAPASAIIRDLLKNDETLKLPKAEEVEIAPLIDTSKRSADEQAELREKRKAAKKAKQEAERIRRAQSGGPRGPWPSEQGSARNGAFVVEQELFRRDPPCETGQRAVAAHDAVTRHDDRDRVATVRRADRPCLVPVPHSFGLLAVAHRLAERNLEQRHPCFALEIGADRVERNVEVGPRSGEVLPELAGGVGDDRADGGRNCSRTVGARAVGDTTGVVVGPEHRADAGGRRDDGQGSDGTLDDGAVQRVVVEVGLRGHGRSFRWDGRGGVGVSAGGSRLAHRWWTA